MKEFKVKIEGIAPLRMNRFLGDLKGGKQKQNDEEKIKEAYERTYKDGEGNYIIEAKAIKACVLNGAKRIKVGRKSAYGDLKAILYCKNLQDKLTYKEKDIVVTEEVCKIPPKTGALAIKNFVIFRQWFLEFSLTLVDDRFPDDALKNSIIEAGMYAGLLDGRPDYGRFVLKSFERVK